MNSNNSAEFVFQNDPDQQIFRMHSSRSIQPSVLRAMYGGDRRFCDVTLYGVPLSGKTTEDLQPICAQKSVLAFASKHLFDLFTSDDYTDSNQAEYHIENVDHDTLGRIVELIYTDQLTTSAEDAVDIVCRMLTGAKYLIIPNLADACETYLASDAQIKPGNCVRLWCFARKYSCLELMHATSSHIAKNLVIVPTNAEFLRMSYSDCAKLLLSENMITANPDHRCLAAIAWLKHDETGRATFVSDIIDMVPLTFGEVSANTIHEAYNCELLKMHGPDAVDRLMNGVLEKLKSAPPAVSASFVNFASNVDDSWNRNWYVCGGKDTKRSFTRYDVSRRMWLQLPDLPWTRTFFGACAVGNQLVAVGGMKTGIVSSDIDTYDATTETWTNCAKMHTPRRALALCSDGQKVFAIGGDDGDTDYCSAEKYSWKSNETVQVADMGSKRSFFAAVLKSNLIFAVGGFGSGGTVEKYDIRANAWSNVCQLYKNRYDLAATIAGDDLYLLGGRQSKVADLSAPSAVVEVVNIRTGQIRTAPNLVQARKDCCATTLHCGSVVCVVGGCGCNDVALNDVEAYDPREGKWTTGTIVPDMPTAAFGFGFAAL